MRRRTPPADSLPCLPWAAVALLFALCIPRSGTAQVADQARDWPTSHVDTLRVLDLVRLDATQEITGESSPRSEELLRTREDFVAKHRMARTQGEIFLINFAILAGNWVMRGKNTGFHVDFDSWYDNLKNGWTWDDNNFPTNHFLHPYHGSLYMNAARANGYDFWQGIPMTFFGSWQWEYFGETHPPSMNDWIITSYSGIAFGEVLYRLSSMVLDNTATGSERNWREAGGALVSPVRFFNRLFTGQLTAVHANEPDRFPSTLGGSLDLGFRTVGDNRIFEQADDAAFYVNFEANYGDMFEDEWEKPFDYFDFLFQLNMGGPKKGIGRIRAHGVLAGIDVAESEFTKHRLGAVQRFDYMENRAFEFGGQSLAASYMSRVRTRTGFEVQTRVDLVAQILAGTRSDYLSLSGREYDYGPGLGWKLSAKFLRNGRDFLTLENDQYWIHAINGNDADHYLTFVRARLDIPLNSFVGVGFDYLLYLAERTYAEYPDVSQRNPELQIYLNWNLDNDFD